MQWDPAQKRLQGPETRLHQRRCDLSSERLTKDPVAKFVYFAKLISHLGFEVCCFREQYLIFGEVEDLLRHHPQNIESIFALSLGDHCVGANIRDE